MGDCYGFQQYHISFLFFTLYNAGISFFTFQAMSYVIDVYRKDAEPQYNVAKVALYVTAFSQLVAGPIVRYTTVMNQIEYREIKFDQVANGIVRFVIGLAKKILIANSLGAVADSAFNVPNGEISTLLAWLGVVAYALQIYYDFSGYSDMAIGMGKMLGFEFEENFNYPYISKSITEFWRRWHMSLGTWFRDYLYIPLGGSRKGLAIQIRNLLIVWAATGLWHGAAWTFVIWGLYYGVLLILEKLSAKAISKVPDPIKWVFTTLLVLIGWVFFRAVSITSALQYIRNLTGVGNVLSEDLFRLLFHDNWFVLMIACLGATPTVKILGNKIISLFKMENYSHWVIKAAITCTLLAVCTVYLVNSTYNPFIYFRF